MIKNVLAFSEYELFDVISILDESIALVYIHEGMKSSVNKNLGGIFYIKGLDFDIGEDKIEKRYVSEEEFVGLKNFIDNLDGKVSALIVCCGGGISRSAGVAEAISEYLNINLNLWEISRFHPNILYYLRACDVLGVPYSKEKLIELFDTRSRCSMFHCSASRADF